MYIQNKSKKNKSLVWYIDPLMIETVHGIMEKSKLITYI